MVRCKHSTPCVGYSPRPVLFLSLKPSSSLLLTYPGARGTAVDPDTDDEPGFSRLISLRSWATSLSCSRLSVQLRKGRASWSTSFTTAWSSSSNEFKAVKSATPSFSNHWSTSCGLHTWSSRSQRCSSLYRILLSLLRNPAMVRTLWHLNSRRRRIASCFKFRESKYKATAISSWFQSNLVGIIAFWGVNKNSPKVHIFGKILASNFTYDLRINQCIRARRLGL